MLAQGALRGGGCRLVLRVGVFVLVGMGVGVGFGHGSSLTCRCAGADTTGAAVSVGAVLVDAV